jgi:O-acetyl-ADP-ribose deacetylase (regulator of RNase III)
MIGRFLAHLHRRRMNTLKTFGPHPAGDLRLSLADHNPEVADALARSFDRIDGVEVLHGNLLDLTCEAIVSPANSFGDMSGGIDKAIDDFHHGAAQRALTAAIAEHFLGELPVGAALVVELPSRQCPFLVAAPTMRVPSDIRGTINAYLALRAALVAVLRHNAGGRRAIRTLGVPGLGTGVGALPPREAADQMRTAYDNVVGERWRQVVHPALAPYPLR